MVVITNPQDKAANVANPTSILANSAKIDPIPTSENAFPNGFGKNLSKTLASFNLAISGVGNSALST